MNKKLFLLTTLIFIVSLGIQIYHLKHDGDIKYICNSFGNFRQRPLLTILWVIITLIGSFILSHSSKLSKNFMLFYNLCVFLLIVIANLDYEHRGTDYHKFFQYIHYFFTILFFVFSFYVFHAHTKSKIIILFYVLFILFCILHLLYYALNSKKKIIKTISTILELLLFYILVFTVLIKISLHF